MKFAAVSLSFLASILLASVGHADDARCPEQLGRIVSRQGEKRRITREGYAFAKHALKHYRQEEIGGKAYIESIYEYQKDGQPTGYRITVTDGGDESSVRYYLDLKGRLIYAKWYNQTPIAYWFCGKTSPISENME